LGACRPSIAPQGAKVLTKNAARRPADDLLGLCRELRWDWRKYPGTRTLLQEIVRTCRSEVSEAATAGSRCLRGILYSVKGMLKGLTRTVAGVYSICSPLCCGEWDASNFWFRQVSRKEVQYEKIQSSGFPDNVSNVERRWSADGTGD
jgi:hypothetical protein